MDITEEEKFSKSLFKSFSFSGSPVSQRISIEQLFKNKEGEIIARKIDYNQYYSHNNSNQKSLGVIEQSYSVNRNNVQITPNVLLDQAQCTINHKTDLKQFPFNDFFNFNFIKPTTEKYNFKTPLSRKLNILPECTPMEIDKSFGKDDSMNDVHDKEDPAEEIKTHESKVPKMMQTRMRAKFSGAEEIPKQVSNKSVGEMLSSIKKLLKIIVFVCIPVILAGLFMTSKQTGELNFRNENMTVELERLVYGQREFISKFKETLNTINEKEILVFVGGIGVGKTYSSQIITENYPWNLINLNTQEIFKNMNAEYVLVRMVENKYNLVLIDNLTANKASEMSQFVNRLLTSDKKMIVILIFSVPVYSLELTEINNLTAVEKQISGDFNNKNVSHRSFIFNNLSVDSVKECIRHSLSRKHEVFSESLVENILENVNYKYAGCKGVYSKVALLA